MQNNYTIDVENSINSGQVFLWQRDDNHWYGTNGQDVLQISSSGRIKSYQNIKTDFFREKDDLEKIIKSISKDKTTKMAVNRYLRIKNTQNRILFNV